MAEYTVTLEDMELWIGTDHKGNYPKEFVLKVLCELANGEYEQKVFRDNVLDNRR